MGSVRLNTNSFGLKGLAELNYHSRDDHKEVRDGVVGEGQGLSEEDELRINELAEDITDRREGKIPRQPVLQEQDPQPQGLVDRWERFLPLRSLKVLLVENDDSTRQVVSALLRNCSYEVTAASNGLQAWKILEDENNHIDLVLTEVVMPCLSGIGLLCKIMNHITRKNIPVIMMSSHDSMGIVFKCLSKGAVDFLVKPIRKNELKNLWQHVWRRCHSSCGSGSESGIQTQKSAKSKSIEDSDINAGSNDDDDNGSIGLNVRDGSDNGSGTQSSWTKRAIEIDSPEPMSPCEQFADPHDSTCAQVIHPKPVTVCNDWVPMISAREHQEQKEQPIENVVMGIDLEIGVPTKLDLHLDSSPSEKVSTNQAGRKRDEEQVNTGSIKPDNSNPSGKPVSLAADLIGVIAHRQMGMGIVAETPNSLSRSSEIEDKSTFEAKDLPFLELSLKRLRSAGDSGTASNDERTVLRRSDMSAFSRYHTAVAAIQTPTGYGGSCCPLDNGSEAVKTESMHNLPSNSNAAALLKQGSNGSNNNNYMGSATKNVFCKPASTSAPKCLHPSSAFQPVQLCCTCAPQQAISEKADDVASAAVALGQPRVAQHQIHVQHHLCCHHHNHHIHGMLHQQKQQLPPDPDELALKNMAAAAPQCRSSNVFGGTADGNTGNYSLNGSMSGSNHGSNGQNGSGSGSGSGVDQNRFAQRVAALTKFRQKRKERCFEKKVRYQSRKRLAEQRPRVRGQFVRQIVYEHSSRDSDF